MCCKGREWRTTSSLAVPADVRDGGPFGEGCCQPRQTAAPGSAPDLTETSPSISHVIWVSEGVCALLAVTLTRRHKLFLSRCSLMHLSLIPPPWNNTKTQTHACRVLITRAHLQGCTSRILLRDLQMSNYGGCPSTSPSSSSCCCSWLFKNFWENTHR